MTASPNPFASQSVFEHAMLGLAALAFVLLAIWLLTTPDSWRIAGAVPSLIAALILMRGCPMCWLSGLIATIMKKSGKAVHHD